MGDEELNLDGLNEFRSLVDKLVEEKINKMLESGNIELVFEGIVKDLNTVDNVYTVDLISNVTDYLPNKTQKTPLSEGDRVKVYSDKSNLVGAYIGVVF